MDPVPLVFILKYFLIFNTIIKSFSSHQGSSFPYFPLPTSQWYQRMLLFPPIPVLPWPTMSEFCWNLLDYFIQTTRFSSAMSLLFQRFLLSIYITHSPSLAMYAITYMCLHVYITYTYITHIYIHFKVHLAHHCFLSSPILGLCFALSV